MSGREQPRIVVALAQEQPATLRFAIDEARRAGLELEVVHCAGYANHVARTIERIYFDNWLEAAEDLLDDARAVVSGESNPPMARYRISTHSPLDELLEISTEAAEIVVGSDDPTWFARVLGTAVSRTLAFTALCPVVVVPEQTATPGRAHGVVVGIEGIGPEDHVLRYAFDHADHLGRELRVVHALPPDTWAGESEAREAVVAEALAGWGEKYPDVKVSRKLVRGEPGVVCARATRGAELVVIGQPHGSQIPFGFDKPVSDNLLRRAVGPVAIVPDPLP